MKNKKSWFPLLILFIILNCFFIAAKNWLLKKGIDHEVLIAGNLVLFLAISDKSKAKVVTFDFEQQAAVFFKLGMSVIAENAIGYFFYGNSPFAFMRAAAKAVISSYFFPVNRCFQGKMLAGFVGKYSL